MLRDYFWETYFFLECGCNNVGTENCELTGVCSCYDYYQYDYNYQFDYYDFDITGVCPCKKGFVDDKCDKCDTGYYTTSSTSSSVTCESRSYSQYCPKTLIKKFLA